MENGYFEKRISPSDRFMNQFVRLALLLRGSRHLFSSISACEEYLKTAECKAVSVSAGKVKNCTVSKEAYRDTEYYIFKPENALQTQTAVMYFHGGAYVRRLTSHHVRLIKTLCAKTGFTFVVPLYLTLPEYTCRESLGQLMGIYKSLLEKNENVIFAGDSCGGAICVSLLAHINDEKLKKPKKLVLFSPFLDHEIIGDAETERIAKRDPMFGGTKGLGFLAERWCSGFEKDDPHAEPLYTDFGMNVPLCIFTSDGDMLSVGCKRFFEKAKDFGAPVRIVCFEKVFHCFVLYPLAAARECIDEAAKLMKEE